MTAHTDLSDHALAAALAHESGDLLLQLRKSASDRDPKQLRDDGDRLSHEHLAAALASARPDDAVLSEEGKDDHVRLDANRVWIVDPLDGTREYGEDGRVDWAVHVALWQGGDLVAGAVALPARDMVLSTGEPPVLPAPYGGPPRLLVSRTRPPGLVSDVADQIGGELVPLGSAGAKAMAVALGEAEIYLHAGGQYEWDSAAPVAVALSAGLHCSRVDGSPLIYNREDPLLPDLLICRPEYADAVLEAVAKTGLS
ncbi:MAG: 3(2), 5-bisphosphate nucleotidase [Frankiales bacterium]|jgi:3'(2'), 5'-bisphosphate nucleotidase|nr:3(2), 5-bisphosphate nucleotidase [Frankiales bacterium]